MNFEHEYNEVDDEQQKRQSSVSTENEYNEVEETHPPNSASMKTENSDMGKGEHKRQSGASKENEYSELDDDDNWVSHEYSDVEEIAHLMGRDSTTTHKRDTLVPEEDKDEDLYDDTVACPKDADSGGESTLKRSATPMDYLCPEDFGITKSMRSPSLSSESSSKTNSWIESRPGSTVTSPDGIGRWKSQSSSGLPGSESDTSSDRPVSWASSDAGSDYINMSKSSRNDLYLNFPPHMEAPTTLDHNVSSDSELEEEEKKQREFEEEAKKNAKLKVSCL
jgi:hypothetical protein